MSYPTMAQDILRGRVLVRQIAQLKAELDEITERMEARAMKGPHVPLEDKSREGRQFLATAENVILPVVITADSLVQSFPDAGPLHLALAGLAGEHLPAFFKRVIKWETCFKDGQKFRTKAAEVLGEKAAKFVTGCVAKDKLGLPKSKVEIAWNRATETEVTA